MTEQTFYNLVRKYREAERMYDRTKHYVYASDIINLQKQIDRAIKDNIEAQERKKQTSITFQRYEDLSE